MQCLFAMSLPPDTLCGFHTAGQEVSSGGQLKGSRGRAGRGMLRGLAAGVILLMLLGAYAWRTVDRNWDWEDEERLFRAALKV